MSAPYEDSDVSDSDEEEPECRVCRGPAEEGRPLFKPCKCSGSIGLTHQDCLTSWLEVTRGDGKCELCSTRFQFAPQYADGTPDRLPTGEVCFRILRRLGAKWLPRGLRAVFAASLWLVVLPLSTSYIYHGWMHRPRAIADRWRWELVKTDIVGGAVIAIIVVVSFLSLMSFAEFLRFQWGGPGGGAAVGQQGGERRGNRMDRARRGGNNGHGAAIEGDIDDIVEHHDEDDEDGIEDDPLAPFLNDLRVGDEGSDISNGDGNNTGMGGSAIANKRSDANNNNSDSIGGNEAPHEPKDDARRDHDFPHSFEDAAVEMEAFMRDQEEEGHAEENNEHNNPLVGGDNGDDQEDELEAFMRAQDENEEHDVGQGNNDNNNPEPRGANNAPNLRPRDDMRFEPQFEPLQPAFADLDVQEDGAEVEINVALDELLGFRGPLIALVRNLLWLLVFNTAYLGVFAFAPSKFGGAMYVAFLKLPSVYPIRDTIPESVAWVVNFWDNFAESMNLLENKSHDMNSIYLPSQVAKMGLGYMSFSFIIFVMKLVVAISTRPPRGVVGDALDQELDGERNRGRAPREGRNDVPLHIGPGREMEENEDVEPFGKKLLGFLECAAAIAKVVTLLFIKMLFLPLMLGIWLDIATLPLFEETWSDRIEFAGYDLFGSVLLHWVVGITFMLLVTVSVLQLREVTHPDILARVIRPQEPQPDLLGNLLQENIATHTKRVLLSLGIYAALLAIHIWLPARLLFKCGMSKFLPVFQPKFWHVLMPQIQVPAELFLFHLCMLGVLEKYKNNIGGMQHHWLLMLGNFLGMTDQILPREVKGFSLVGTLPVFTEDALQHQLKNVTKTTGDGPPDNVHNEYIFPLWSNLISEGDLSKKEAMIRSSIDVMDRRKRASCYLNGTARRDGKILLSTHSFIRLPGASSTLISAVKTSDADASNLLPTCIGRYRLRQGVSRVKEKGNAKMTTIEIWCEDAGTPIPRPPEGWDDLGVGGAERHGRWAWGDEQPSAIENSVAVRNPFFNDPDATKMGKACVLIQLVAKMIFLLFLSWVAISVVLCVGINTPLHTGHFALYLLRVPGSYIHDPLAFAIGVLLLIPVVALIVKLLYATTGSRGLISLLLSWFKSFKPHYTPEKVKTLLAFFLIWLVLCPVQLGFLHSRFFVGIRDSSDWYVDTAFLLLVNWGTGTLLLNSWAAMCYFQMFTINFWANLIIGEAPENMNPNRDNGADGPRQGDGINPPRNAGRENAIQVDDANEPKMVPWQGKDGAIANAIESIKAFVIGWEWDKVDRQSLLQDCAYSVSKHLAIACAVPVAALSLAEVIDGQVGATAVFRTFTIAGVTVDFIYSSKHSLRRWFKAAHKIARDDRYLIGEILLNYSPRQASATA